MSNVTFEYTKTDDQPRCLVKYGDTIMGEFVQTTPNLWEASVTLADKMAFWGYTYIQPERDKDDCCFSFLNTEEAEQTLRTLFENNQPSLQAMSEGDIGTPFMVVEMVDTTRNGEPCLMPKMWVVDAADWNELKNEFETVTSFTDWAKGWSEEVSQLINPAADPSDESKIQSALDELNSLSTKVLEHWKTVNEGR